MKDRKSEFTVIIKLGMPNLRSSFHALTDDDHFSLSYKYTYKI